VEHCGRDAACAKFEPDLPLIRCSRISAESLPTHEGNAEWPRKPLPRNPLRRVSLLQRRRKPSADTRRLSSYKLKLNGPLGPFRFFILPHGVLVSFSNTGKGPAVTAFVLFCVCGFIWRPHSL
jgi:hypothetical protein